MPRHSRQTPDGTSNRLDHRPGHMRQRKLIGRRLVGRLNPHTDYQATPGDARQLRVEVCRPADPLITLEADNGSGYALDLFA